MGKTTTKTTSMNIRLDADTRRKLQAFADKLGIPATTLAAANIKQMLRAGEVRLTTTLEPTPYLEKIMHEVDTDIKTGKNISKAYDNVDDFFGDLDKNP
jgi:antitoxin component of RelBE/YafQ-DinJ toxin-antitoxin module